MKFVGAAVFLAGSVIWFAPAATAQTSSKAPAQTSSKIPATRPAQAVHFRNTDPGTRYVGSKVCGACHPRIFSSYIKTGMGRSVIAGDDKSLVDRLPVPFAVFDQKTGLSFEVSRRDGALYQSEYALDREGKEVFRQTWPLAYALGAGENGFGFIIQHDGHLFEAPLTYYTRPEAWDLSPGYELRNDAFARPILARCIGCHSGRPQPVPDRVGAYRAPPLAELAVGCENCHGPGERHVAARQTGRAPAGGVDTNIVNPARLPGWLADNICMKCHQGGDVRVTQPGKQEQDFRPGTPLGNVMAIFKVPLHRDSKPQSVLLEHYFAMTLSKCYRASAGRLRCITCHNPHAQLTGREAGEFYRTKCLGCHRPENCTLPAEERLRKSPNDDCASCHMPKRDVTTITHAALTDHMIAARPGEPYPEEAFPWPALSRTGLLHLTATPDETPSSVPAVTLLQAYLDLIRDGHREFTPRKDDLLDQLVRNAPGNPVVLAALANRAASKNTPESRLAAIEYLARAILGGARTPEDFLLLADLYGGDNRHAEAIRVLDKGLEANPYFRELYEATARHQMALGQYANALQTIRKGLDLFPDDITLRLLETEGPK